MSSPTQLSLPMDDDKNDFGSPVYDDLDFAADLPEFYYDHTLLLDPSPARAERSPARFHLKHFLVDGQKHFDNNDSNNDADKYKYDADKYKYDAKPERVADQLSAPFALNLGLRFNFSHLRNVSLDDSSYRRQNALYSHRPSASISADPPLGLFPHSHLAATLHLTSLVPALLLLASNALLLDSPYSAATPARRRKLASILSLTTSLSPARVGKTPLKSHRRTRLRIDRARAAPVLHAGAAHRGPGRRRMQAVAPRPHRQQRRSSSARACGPPVGVEVVPGVHRPRGHHPPAARRAAGVPLRPRKPLQRPVPVRAYPGVAPDRGRPLGVDVAAQLAVDPAHAVELAQFAGAQFPSPQLSSAQLPGAQLLPLRSHGLALA